MSIGRYLLAILAAAVLHSAADPPWKTKQIPDWTPEDAKMVLTDSPWAGSVTATIAPPGSGRGWSHGGFSVGLPGIGMGRPSTGGYPGGGQRPAEDESAEPPVLHLRWESAMPIRDAELKAREVGAPDIDPGSYAIAVYGIPPRMASGDQKSMAGEFKKLAAIKREGQKDLKPSSVEVLQREDGPVIVYLFSRKVEIGRKDRRLEFEGQVGRLQFTKTFYPEEMVWQGKLEM